jgi:hypothetical protein
MHCHAFTLAVDRICHGGGEAFVRVDGHGNVSHSVYRLPNTRTHIDETGAVRLDSVPGTTWRAASMAEIAAMATRRNRGRRARAVLANIAARSMPC